MRKRINSMINAIASNPAIIISLVLVVLAELGVRLFEFGVIESTMARIGTFVLLSFCLIVPKERHYRAFQVALTFTIPLSVLVLAILMLVKPLRVDNFSYNDGVIENLSLLAVFLAAFLWLMFAFMKRGSTNRIVPIGAFVIALGLIAIGGEEVSWGQRLLDITPNDFFEQNNMQGETNFHNLNTFMSEAIYYTGAGILLVVLPFFRDKIVNTLEKMKRAKALTPFLPGEWLFPAFVSMFAIVGTGTASYPTVMFITVFSVVAVLYKFFTYVVKRDYRETVIHGCILIVMIITILIFMLFDYGQYGMRQWMYTEYFETYIAVGLLVYTIDALFRNRAASERKNVRVMPRST